MKIIQVEVIRFNQNHLKKESIFIYNSRIQYDSIKMVSKSILICSSIKKLKQFLKRVGN